MTDHGIRNLEQRLEAIEDVLSMVSAGEYNLLDVDEASDADLLCSVELGINIVLQELIDEIENTRTINDNLDGLVAERTQELEDKLALITEQNELITRQQKAISELSTPILQLWKDVIALPIIGVVDTRRSAEIMERLLHAITSKASRFVILDITGVEIVDTKTADHFIKVVKAAELLGAECLITGIRPAVAQTLVDIGVDLSSVRTMGSIEEALGVCIRSAQAGNGGRTRS